MIKEASDNSGKGLACPKIDARHGQFCGAGKERREGILPDTKIQSVLKSQM